MLQGGVACMLRPHHFLYSYSAGLKKRMSYILLCTVNLSLLKREKKHVKRELNILSYYGYPFNTATQTMFYL